MDGQGLIANIRTVFWISLVGASMNTPAFPFTPRRQNHLGSKISVPRWDLHVCLECRETIRL